MKTPVLRINITFYLIINQYKHNLITKYKVYVKDGMKRMENLN